MGGRRTYQGISKRARTLLAQGEGPTVDYKRDIRGLTAEDLVSFANAATGGVILVGVEESRAPNGRQIGRPIGCDVSDQTRLHIVNKAQECIPPVAVDVFIESAKGTPFLRVEVGRSGSRPHCTSAGLYKMRSDGRNRPLRPEEIAAILLERESESFQERFKQATESLAVTLQEVVNALKAIDAEVHDQLVMIAGSAETAGSEASDAAWTLRTLEDSVSTAEALARSNWRELTAVHRRLAYLLEGAKVTDPVADQAKAALQEELEEYFNEHPDEVNHVMGGVAVQITSSNAACLTAAQARDVLESVVKSVTSKKGQTTANRASRPKKKARRKKGGSSSV